MSSVTQMSAGDVLDALEKAWKESALVRELTITDTRELYRELEKGERHGPLKRRIDALMFSPDGMRTAIEVKVDVASRFFVAISGVSSRVGGVIVVVAGRSTWCARKEKRVSVCSRCRAHCSLVWLAVRVVGRCWLTYGNS